MKIQKAMIYLDALFDTRLGCIAKVDNNIATKIVTDPVLFKRYQTRHNDDMSFLGVNQKAYKAQWEKRNAMLLPSCLTTVNTFLLTKLITQLEISTEHNANVYDGFELHLNIWPYTNMSAEVSEYLAHCVQESVGIKHPFKIVSVSLNDLTSSHLVKNDYTVVMCYDIDPWLTYHFNETLSDDEALEIAIPNVTFMSAFLIPDMSKFKKLYEFKNPIGEQCPPHIGMSKLLEPFVGIQYMGLIYYCIPESSDYLSLELVREQLRK